MERNFRTLGLPGKKAMSYEIPEKTGDSPRKEVLYRKTLVFVLLTGV